jgi:ubiquinone biosynthesis protein
LIEDFATLDVKEMSMSDRCLQSVIYNYKLQVPGAVFHPAGAGKFWKESAGCPISTPSSLCISQDQDCEGATLAPTYLLNEAEYTGALLGMLQTLPADVRGLCANQQGGCG